MDERLRRVLRERVEQYLAGVERLLDAAAQPAAWDALRERFRPLVAGWRALLDVHSPDAAHRCRHCSTSWRRRSEPCSVWRTANAVLVARFPDPG